MATDPGELNERAATLQEKRGLSRYGERYKGKRAGDGRTRKEKKRETRHGEHCEERKTKGDTAQGALQGGETKGPRHRKHWEEVKQTERARRIKDSEESLI
ncbi:hypothetical protein NDU88_001858 [Pleurodeles waltl]|uniref:Uncharacterized protein n=1 Tax=Pleurodeles waltl TaxID=8319 RepID=A0AAV7UBH9_PLEWA|nr:hypothetical protein NDU88_001858 [Pleurodeles waltl]